MNARALIPIQASPLPLAKALRFAQAFTVVELLVVVAVIALLGGLAFPALQKALDGARTTACAANLRQIGMGFAAYAADHDGYHPAAQAVAAPAGETDFWEWPLWTYVGYAPAAFNYPTNDFQGNTGADRNVFNCPVTKNYPAARFKEICVPNGIGGPGARFSYSMNDCPNLLVGTTTTPIKRASLARPAEAALVMEQWGNNCNQWNFPTMGLLPHGGGTNVLFFDGHVAWLRFQEIPPATATPPAFWTGN